MSGPGARIGRFVRAARSLLLMQVAAAAVALVLGVWAVLAVRDLATERDELRARVAELETQRPAAPAAAAPSGPTGPAPSPLDTEIRPPAILPVPIPVTETTPDPVVPEPSEPATIPDPTTGEPATTPPPPEQDCSGANANQARCRPGRWTRRDPVLQRPVRPVRPEPQFEREPRPTPR